MCCEIHQNFKTQTPGIAWNSILNPKKKCSDFNWLFKDAYIWIGLNDKDDDGIYRYFSTGSLTYIIDLWDKDQPTGDRYVATQAKKNGKWSTFKDNYSNKLNLYSVCEKLNWYKILCHPCNPTKWQMTDKGGCRL